MALVSEAKIYENIYKLTTELRKDLGWEVVRIQTVNRNNSDYIIKL